MCRTDYQRRAHGLRGKNRGFTLIEVLVSIAIFASLSVGAYQVLNQVQRSNELSQERSDRLKELQRAIVLMDADFRQMASRGFRTNGEESQEQWLYWSDYLLDSESKGVLFTRGGWHNPQQQFPRGEVTKVGYRLQNEVLERVWWRYPDTPIGQEGAVTPILTQVEEWRMQFYDGERWKDEWSGKAQLPKAVSVTLMTSDYGEIERVYLVAGGNGVSDEDNDESS